jgi:hypothetical protein
MRPNGEGKFLRRFAISLAAAAIGITQAFSSAPAFAKTAAQCNADYAANKAAIKASGQTKKAYVTACRADTTGAPPVSAPATTAAPAPMAPAHSQIQTHSTPPSFTPAWQSLKIGGGGEMNNIQIASDGTAVTSANTMGAYLLRTSGTCAGADNGGWGSDYSAPCWEQLFTQTSATLTLRQITQLAQGVNEIDSCNSNTNDAYALFNKTLWFTTNLKAAAASRRWTPTSLTTTDRGNQGISNGTARIIVCDPNNAQIVYVSTPAAVKASGNGLSSGATFATVTGIGTIGTVPDVLAYDGNPSASTGTCSQYSGSPTCTLHLLVFVDGTGVYETYNGGSSFTLTSSGPTTAAHGCEGGYCLSLKADQFGNFWAEIGDSHIYEYVPNGTAGGGTWSTKSPSVNNSANGEFALDPTSGSSSTLRIVSTYADGNISVSTDGGVSWCTWSAQSFTASGSQPPWFGNANQGQAAGGVYLAAKDLSFDTSGNLYLAAGIGVWEMTSANVGCGATWTAASVGIENLVSNHVDAPSGSVPIVGVWDRGFWSLNNPDVFPSDYWPDYNLYSHSFGPINGGWAFDWAGSNTNFVAGWAGNNNIVPTTTANDGVSWTIWSSVSLGTINIFGVIATSTPLNWIVVPSGNSGNLQFTTDGGTSFAAATTTGMTLPISSGRHLAADRVTANTFCLIDNNIDLWASTNGGSTWTKNSTGLEGAGISYNDEIKGVPGQAGIYYYSGGNAGGGATNFHLWKITKTTNECDTVADVNSNITNIFAFGYGVAKPGGNGFPTIYYYGAYNGVMGLYEIDNGGSTPALISAPSAAQTWPNNSPDFVATVSGDMNVYGRVYVGDSGSGFSYIDTASACPAVSFEYSSVHPGQALSGTAVTLTAQNSGLSSATITGVSFYLDGSTQIGSTQTGRTRDQTYSVIFNADAQTVGTHTLTVTATGNGCTSSGNSVTIRITTL